MSAWCYLSLQPLATHQRLSGGSPATSVHTASVGGHKHPAVYARTGEAAGCLPGSVQPTQAATGAAPRQGFPRHSAACAAHLARERRVGGLRPRGSGSWRLRCGAASAGTLERRAGRRRAHGLARGSAVRGRRCAAAAAIWVGARARPAGGAALASARRGCGRRRRVGGVAGGACTAAAWRGVRLQAARPGAGAEAARACSPHARHPVSGPVLHV
jgi:hypothetical protein